MPFLASAAGPGARGRPLVGPGGAKPREPEPGSPLPALPAAGGEGRPGSPADKDADKDWGAVPADGDGEGDKDKDAGREGLHHRPRDLLRALQVQGATLQKAHEAAVRQLSELQVDEQVLRVLLQGLDASGGPVAALPEAVGAAGPEGEG